MTAQGQGNLREVRVDKMNTRRHSHGPAGLEVDKRQMAKVSSRSNDFVFVNPAYVGSTNSLSQARVPAPNVVAAPTTSVYREQYWACSRWPYGQRILAITVGVLLGTIVALAITMGLASAGERGLFGSLTAPD